MKKKDKKKFKREKINLRNLDIDNLEDFYIYEDELINEKRAEKKIVSKSQKTQKNNVNLVKGRILEVMSNLICKVKLEDEIIECTVGGRLKNINYRSRNLVAPGDFVNVDMSKNPRIEEILPRKNSISRYSESRFQNEIILASNIDLLVVVASLKEPMINLGLIDRFICAAELQKIPKILICVNKIDLGDSLDSVKRKMDFYVRNGYKVVFTSAKKSKGIELLKKELKNKISVFAGHSGTGKSSLINRLQPDLNVKVKDISSYSMKGKHTTSSTKLYKFNFGGYLTDTPGIKTFGLRREEADYIPYIFPGISNYSAKCHFNNCTHTHEEDCALKLAVKRGIYPKERYNSYLRIYESLK